MAKHPADVPATANVTPRMPPRRKPGDRPAPRGEAHRSAKLTERAVLSLRARARDATGTPRGVGFFAREATRYGVRQPTICAAVYGDTWQHLPGALRRRLSSAGGRTVLPVGASTTRARQVVLERPLFGITEHPDGVWVRLQYVNGRPRVQQFFGARASGGWRKARVLAVAFRDEALGMTSGSRAATTAR